MNGLEPVKSPTKTLQEGTINELGIQSGVTASASGLLSQPSELCGACSLKAPLVTVVLQTAAARGPILSVRTFLVLTRT